MSERCMREALEAILKDAPQPQDFEPGGRWSGFAESNNYGDVAAVAAEREHLRLAAIARAALKTAPGNASISTDALIDEIFGLAQKINLNGHEEAAGILGDLCTALSHGFVDDLHAATRDVVMRFKEAHAVLAVGDDD